MVSVEAPFGCGRSSGRRHGLHGGGRVAVTVVCQAVRLKGLHRDCRAHWAAHSAVRSESWGPHMLIRRAVQVQRGDRLKEGNEERVVHEFVNDAASFIELRRMGRIWATGEVE